MKRLALALLLGAIALARDGSARVVKGDDESETVEREPSLRTRIGVPAALQLMTSAARADRVRGLERLGATATPRALFQLVRAVSPNGGAVTPEERLTAVRQLASFSGDADARRALAFVLAGHLSPQGQPEGTPHPLDALAEGTAALALARSGTPDAAVSLGKALSGSGPSSRHASAALLAYPPRDLSSILKSVSLPSVALARLLGDLGDQRGLDALRDLVRRAPLPVRAAAAVSLTRLGDYEAVELARKWSAPGEDPVLRLAAAKILVLSRDRDAARLLASLLDSAETADAGLGLVLEMPDPSLAPALERRLAGADDARAGAVLAALGACESAEAATFLERAMKTPALESHAAEALSRMKASAARAAIGRALGDAGLRRNALRAAAARLYLLKDEVPGWRAASRALARSESAADRAAAAAAEGLASRDKIWPSLWSKDAAVSAAAQALLLAAPTGVPEAIAAELPWGAPGAAIVLALPSARRAATTASLTALAGAMDVSTPVAARALTARDDLRIRETTRAFLESTDATIRAHAAAGLAESKQPDAVGLLAGLYRFEADAGVRRAVVRALSRLPTPGRTSVLRLAAELDPDVPTRTAARIALAGTRLQETSAGDALVWLHRQRPAEADASKAPGSPPSARAVALPSGLAVPAVPAPDGELLIPGLPAGSRAVRVAPDEKADDAAERGKRGSEKSAPGIRTR